MKLAENSCFIKNVKYENVSDFVLRKHVNVFVSKVTEALVFSACRQPIKHTVNPGKYSYINVNLSNLKLKSTHVAKCIFCEFKRTNI